ncbi:hypothetical protein ACFY8S_09145 [Streptomyces hygroscopicus]|uniref:hypothetical protein n=1 Tax=Streptomyces hygroscopicus TaxID=1912 RepID=UPI00367DC7A4
MTDTNPVPKWPLTLADPVRAVHFALDPGCPHDRPQSCPDEAKARQAIDAYRTWLAAHPSADDRTVIDGQPRDSGPAAPQGPHSPSTTPEGPAAPERATQSRTGDRLTHRTVEYLLQTRQPDDTWEVSSSGTNTPDRAQERLAQRRQRMPQFEHRIAKRTFTVAIEPYPDTGPDSRTDSPDNRQDSTPDTETDSPVTSADTVRTGQDTGPRCVCGDPIEPWTGPGDPGWIHSPGSDTRCVDARPAPDAALRERYAEALHATGGPFGTTTADDLARAVMAVRDRRREQLAAELANQQRRAEQAEDLLRVAHDTSNRAEAERAYAVQRAERAEAERDQAYRERAHLLAWIAALHPANAVITPADDIEEPGWQLLYLLVGGWQMSWHIAPRDAELFAHVEHVDPTDPRAQWDGHSTNEKYERIREHTAQLGEVRTSTVRIEISPDPAHVVDAIRQVRRNGGLPPHRR